MYLCGLPMHITGIGKWNYRLIVRKSGAFVLSFEHFVLSLVQSCLVYQGSFSTYEYMNLIFSFFIQLLCLVLISYSFMFLVLIAI